MQSIGQAWLVYTLTNSPLLLGILGAVQFLPVTILTLFAGVLIDKYPKRKILLITQTVSMILAFALSVLVFTGTVKYGYILILAMLLGITNAIDMPARQAFMFEIAGREDLMNAVALNSVAFNLAKILGPSLGAVLMATLGAGWCFLLNGLSFIAVIYGLLLIKLEPYVREKNSNNILKEINDGLKYIYKNRILLQSVLLLLIVGIFAFNYNVLLPVFVRNVLHQEAKAFGVLMAALGVGSVFGALTISSKSRSGPKMMVMIISSLIIGTLFFLNGFNTQYIAAIIILVVIGAFSIYFSTTANTTLQMNSKNEYRGRVMSVYALVFAGATPIGNIFAGVAVDSLGISNAFMLSGILILGFTVIISLIFIKKAK
jgi:predicted MFS family arabinose efflux permease